MYELNVHKPIPNFRITSPVGAEDVIDDITVLIGEAQKNLATLVDELHNRGYHQYSGIVQTLRTKLENGHSKATDDLITHMNREM